MSAAWVGFLAIAAVVVSATASRRRTTLGLTASVLLTVAALIAIGEPHLRASEGFFIEPARAIATAAILVIIAGASLAGTLHGRRVGLVAAGSILALVAGHAALSAAGWLIASVSVAWIAWTDRAVTRHASVPSRVAAPMLLVSDTILAATVATMSARAVEPVVLGSGAGRVAVIIAILVRVAAGAALREQVSGSVVILSAIAPCVWLVSSPELALLLAAVAAGVAVRAARTSEAWSGSIAWSLVAVCVAAVGEVAAIASLAIVVAMTVAWALSEALPRGSLLLASIAPGAAGVVAADRILEGASNVSLGTVFLLTATMLLLTIAAVGAVRPRRPVSQPVRIGLTAVTGGALMAAAVASGGILDLLTPVVRASRGTAALASTPLEVPVWVFPAAMAVLAIWSWLDRGAQAPEVAEVPARVQLPSDPPVALWQRTAAALIAVASLATLAAMVSSASRGWL